MPDAPSPDLDFLGLADLGDGRFRFEVSDRLARIDGRLYGGTAIAVSVALASVVSDRAPQWMTTQFVSSAEGGTPIDVHVEVLAPGKRTNQIRVTGTTASGAIVFTSLGATGHARPSAAAGQFVSMPSVSSPADSEVWPDPMAGMLAGAGIDIDIDAFPRGHGGFTSAIELRNATVVEHPDPGPGRLCLWMRRRDGAPITPMMAAFMADLVPMAVSNACGLLLAGTSLDNTIRYASFSPVDEFLLDLRPHWAGGDYLHGLAHLWSPDGTLLATASQTASGMVFDAASIPWADGTA